MRPFPAERASAPLIRDWRVSVGFLLASFVVVLVLTLSLAGTDVAERVEAPVLHAFDGVGSQTTAAFEITGDVELGWHHDGYLNAIEWIRTGGGGSSFIEMQGRPIKHRGQVFISEPGQYRVRVTGTGPWELEVRQIGPAATPAAMAVTPIGAKESEAVSAPDGQPPAEN